MYILLIAASHHEIHHVWDFLEAKKFRAGDHEIQISITGIGLVATTYFLTRHIDDRRPDLVIQAGIAGCFTPNRSGEVVAVSEDRLADLGVVEHAVFKTIFDLGLAGENDAPFRSAVLANPYRKLLSLSTLEQVRAITVNQITTETATIERYQQYPAAFVESMEGAAFHYVCLQEKIPFLQLRAVSNDAGERDKSKWHIEKSITNLNEQLILLISKLMIYDETHFRI